MSQTHKPLHGIKILELSHMVMGPTTGMILADLGAQVIKVEPHGGDKTRNLKGSGAGFFPMYSRNKTSVCLDIKSPEGKEAVLRLLETCDALIENFRSGALAKMGLDYDSLSERFPKLIYCSLKGFLSGPYEHRTALDEVTQMMGGLAYMTGPVGRPLRAGASVIDVMGGTFGALGILAALRERERTGLGQHLASGLFETTAFLMGQHMAQESVTGKAPLPMPERVSAWAIYDVFTTQDELPLFVGVVSDVQWQAFCKEFELDDLLQNPKLHANNDRVEARPWLLEEIRSLFKGIDRDPLIERLERIGLPFAPIATPSDLFYDVHLNASGGLVKVQLPEGGYAMLPGLPLEMQGQRFDLYQDLPKPGEHTRETLKQVGYADAEIDNLISPHETN